MSELKAFVARKIDDGTCDPVPCVEVYLKSEADKVIAEKDKEIAELKEHNENYRFDNKNMLNKIMIQDAELRHANYKRCLAMVKYCDMGLTYYNEKLDSFSCERADFFYKWYNRWWKLAEKFKGGK